MANAGRFFDPFGDLAQMNPLCNRHGNRVSITAEPHRDLVQDAWRMARSELYYEKQQRSFTLEQDIDDTRAGARYVDGVLELTLPKKTAGAASKVRVQ